MLALIEFSVFAVGDVPGLRAVEDARERDQKDERTEHDRNKKPDRVK